MGHQRERKIEGGVCAVCKGPIGLILINGKSVEVEAQAVVWDDVLVIKLHCCRSLGPGVTKGDTVVNGRKVANGKP